MLKQVNQVQAMDAKMHHTYRQGMGYIHVGPLQMPPPHACVHRAHECEPLSLASDNSVHFLRPPKGANPMLMRWHMRDRHWCPMVPGAGRRVGFSSEYLAAHGWRYLGPAKAE